MREDWELQRKQSWLLFCKMFGLMTDWQKEDPSNDACMLITTILNVTSLVLNKSVHGNSRNTFICMTSHWYTLMGHTFCLQVHGSA